MIVEVLSEKVYVPKYNGNGELPEDEQIKVTHRFFKAGEKKKYIYTKNIMVNKFTQELKEDVELVIDSEGIVRALVTKIEGLQVHDNVRDKVVEVKTGNDLYTVPGVPEALVVELESYLQSASPEVDKDFL